MGFQFLVNKTPFTSAQNKAVNSSITAEKVTEYDGLVGGIDDYLKKTDAADTNATKDYVEGLGTVYLVAPGANLDRAIAYEKYRTTREV